MASFIELPRLGFGGRAMPSLYVNTDDIIALSESHDGQTRVEVRDMGTDGMAVAVFTYVPLTALLDLLGSLTQYPGVRSWTETMKRSWSEPLSRILEDAANREREAARR